MLSAIVLAAGMSTRMGRNKLLLTHRYKTLIALAVDTLLASAVDEVIVVVGHEAEKIRTELEGRQVRFVFNADYREGMSTSVRVGVAAVSSRADGIMICLADQPLLEPTDLNHLARAFVQAKAANKTIIVPFFRGQRGNPVILDVSHHDTILEVAGDVGCRGVIKRYPDKVYPVEMETDHVVQDIDNLEDYEALADSSSLSSSSCSSSSSKI
jgi:molybdenum cofactor cytidylyltransferase